MLFRAKASMYSKWKPLNRTAIAIAAATPLQKNHCPLTMPEQCCSVHGHV